eukprot:TRINITY_DN13924_c0_g1_i10.p2 TRINITY_DN13924_c0_g1~~TRINITY_DN13924_c0_g1_i10.p2  ORF type:complete len:123 (+),score=11.19 TRINITY_DN13924_c0_g1_i10:364-732(+)
MMLLSLIIYERRRHKDVPQLPSPADHSPSPNPPPEPDPSYAPAPTSIQLRRSTRHTRPLDRYGFTHTSLLAALSTVTIPNSYLQAMKHDYWKKAMQEELDAFRGKSHMGYCVLPISCKTHWL